MGEGQHHLPRWDDSWSGWVGTSFLGNLSLAGLPAPQGSVAPHWGRGGLPLTPLLAAGRTKELSPERLERFTQFSREQGLTDEEILILPQTGERLEGQGGGGEQAVSRGD